MIATTRQPFFFCSLSDACENLIGFFGKNVTDSKAYDSARNDCGRQSQLETDFWAML
jgi:hypothetical protein